MCPKNQNFANVIYLLEIFYWSKHASIVAVTDEE